MRYSAKTTPEIGIAVVGYGYWGPNLVRNFSGSDGGRLYAVSDLDPKKLELVERRFPGIIVTTDFDALLSDPNVDAIAIATPVRTHYELALAALRAGKHVLVEKPLAESAEQAELLIKEAARQKLILMVDHTFLYTPAVQKIRQLIRDGTLGDLFYYNSIRASLGLFQPDVNVVWDLAVHDMAILNYIFDERPVTISATAASHIPGTPENMAHISLFFRSGCIAHISVNWLSPVKVRQAFIGGSRRMIMYDDVEPTEKIKVYDKGVSVHGSSETTRQLRIDYRAGDTWSPHLSPKEALRDEAEHFIACIRDGSCPISSGSTGLYVVEILEAASRSIAAQGSPVRLEYRTGSEDTEPAGFRAA